MKMTGLKSKINEKGLTLLELTLALAIFGMVALVSLNLIYHGFRSSRSFEDKVEIINSMNFALSAISKTIRETNNPGEITITGDSVFDTLSLPENIQIQVQDGVIQKIDNGDIQSLTTDDNIEVTKLQFQFNPENNNNIIIELAVKSLRDGRTVNSRLETAIRPDV